MNKIKELIKYIIFPLRKFFTKFLIEPSVLDYHINRRIWHETNAFRWASGYLVKKSDLG